MLNHLKHWLRPKTGRDDEDDDGPALPILPDPRPGRLTPSPSREDLRLRWSTATATCSSPFFQRLPAEIRELILVEAFGGRTVHLDLDSLTDEYRTEPPPPLILRGQTLRNNIDSVGHYGLWRGGTRNGGGVGAMTQPTTTRLATHDAGSRHPGCAPWDIWNFKYLSVRQQSDDGDHDDEYGPWRNMLRRTRAKKEKRLEWEWWSSVCHRDSERRMRADPAKRHLVPEPWRDRCRRGEAACDGWPGDMPHKCMLGVMGWLLTCRQAYAEGIQVLYATNTLHMTSTALMLNLPDLILPQRLAMVTSLEMIWSIKPPREGVEGEDLRQALQGGKDIFNMLSRKIISPTVFPNLSSLRISLMYDPIVGIPHLGEEAVRRIMDEIIVPLDGMIGRVPARFRWGCHVDLNFSLWRALLVSELWEGAMYEGEDHWGCSAHTDIWRHAPAARAWRPLSRSTVEGQGKGEADRDEAPEGYWIYEGIKDTPPYPFAHINPDYDDTYFLGQRL